MSFVYLSSPKKRKKLFVGICASAFALLIVAGVFASNDWFPRTDAMTGQKFGWFGRKLPKNAPSAWNPLAMPTATPTPQLSKEYIYAGSRLLAVEDANATAAPPADLAVWRFSNGNWYVQGQTGSQSVTQGWGQSGDIPVPGDYDGDGKTDFSIFRPSESKWYIIQSSDSSWSLITWGQTGDIPATADYDGDGKTDRAIYRPNDPSTGYGKWYISTDSYTASTQWGLTGDKPAPADYDGDGKADLGLWRSSNETFYVTYSATSAQTSFAFDPNSNLTLGNADPVSSDYDGDGKADFALFDRDTTYSYWYIRKSSDGIIPSTGIGWGLTTDTPVPNDYDGDGLTDIAVWRPGSQAYWYICHGTNCSSPRTEAWGITDDIPVPAFYRR